MNRTAKHTRISGFTLNEIVVAMALVSVITLGVGILLADAQKNWGRLFGRVYSASATDGFVIQQAFDTVCRKSSLRKYELNSNGDSLKLYYWDPGSAGSTPDNYAHFYQNDEDAVVEYGTLQSGTWQPDSQASTNTVTLASGIDTLKFTVGGTSVQLFVTYTDADTLPVVCSSVRHND